MTDLSITGKRRRTASGRKLHCCCVCNYLGPWSASWCWYGSYKELDANIPVQKFCSEKCKKMAKAVTMEMAEDARQKEYRVP